MVLIHLQKFLCLCLALPPISWEVQYWIPVKPMNGSNQILCYRRLTTGYVVCRLISPISSFLFPTVFSGDNSCSCVQKFFHIARKFTGVEFWNEMFWKDKMPSLYELICSYQSAWFLCLVIHIIVLLYQRISYGHMTLRGKPVLPICFQAQWTKRDASDGTGQGLKSRQAHRLFYFQSVHE